MSWHAFDAIEGAYEKTIGLLFKPFNWRFYLKLALIVLVAVGMSGSGGSNHGSGSDRLKSVVDSTPGLIAVAGLLLGVLVVGVVFGAISSVFEFIFIDAVLTKNVGIRSGFKRRLKQGLKLFLLEFGLIALAIVLGGVVVALVSSLGLAELSGVAKFVLIVAGLIAAIVFVVLLGLVFSFTVDFVAPIMRAKQEGVLGGWATLLSKINAGKLQFLVYVVVKIVLKAGAWFVALIATIPVLIGFAIVLGIPSIAIGLLLYALGVGVSDISSMGLLLIPLILAGFVVFMAIMILFTYVMTVVTLPIHVFFRFYSLLFLDRIMPDAGVLSGGKQEPGDGISARKRAQEAMSSGSRSGGRVEKQEPQDESDRDSADIFID